MINLAEIITISVAVCIGMIVSVTAFFWKKESLVQLPQHQLCRCGHPETEHNWSMDDYGCCHELNYEPMRCWCRDFVKVIEPGFFTNQVLLCRTCGHMEGVHRSQGSRFTGLCSEANCQCQEFINPVTSLPYGGSNVLPPPQRVNPMPTMTGTQAGIAIARYGQMRFRALPEETSDEEIHPPMHAIIEEVEHHRVVKLPQKEKVNDS
jgi:hypothetical protein